MKQILKTLVKNRALQGRDSGGCAVYLYGSYKQQKSAIQQILKGYLAYRPDDTPIVIGGNDATHQFICALSSGTVGDLRTILSRCALLVVPRVEFLGGRLMFSAFMHEILEYRMRRGFPTLLLGEFLPEDMFFVEERNVRQLQQCLCQSLERVDFFQPADAPLLPPAIDGRASLTEADLPVWAVIRLTEPGQAVPLRGVFSWENTRIRFLPEGWSEVNTLPVASADPRYAKGLCWLAENRIPVQLDGLFTDEQLYISALALRGLPPTGQSELPPPSTKVPELEVVDPEAYSFFRDEAAALNALKDAPDGLPRLIAYLDRMDSRQAYHLLFSHYGSEMDDDTRARMKARVIARYGRNPWRGASRLFD